MNRPAQTGACLVLAASIACIVPTPAAPQAADLRQEIIDSQRRLEQIPALCCGHKHPLANPDVFLIDKVAKKCVLLTYRPMCFIKYTHIKNAVRLP